MKLRHNIKWGARATVPAFIMAFLAGFIAYWRSTNDCDQPAALNVPMKAIPFCEYGSPHVLKFEGVEKPVPNDEGHARGKVVIAIE